MVELQRFFSEADKSMLWFWGYSNLCRGFFHRPFFWFRSCCPRFDP
jgi:hypothetical protein